MRHRLLLAALAVVALLSYAGGYVHGGSVSGRLAAEARVDTLEAALVVTAQELNQVLTSCVTTERHNAQLTRLVTMQILGLTGPAERWPAPEPHTHNAANAP